MNLSPELINESSLKEWFDTQGLGKGEDISFERVKAGESNEVFIVKRSTSRWVLRRPSLVPLSFDGSNRIMEREFKFQSALEGTKVPHAKAISLCTDISVTGSFFYVMEWVDGMVPTDPIPNELGGIDSYHHIAIQLLEALGELASVDYEAAGLADLGRPEGFLERQVGRWKGQLDSYQNREIPGIDKVAKWLEDNRPRKTTPGVMHGDYNFHNMLFSKDKKPSLLAVLDWENATIGSRLMDLGYLMGTLNFEHKNMPTKTQSISLWSDRSGIKAESLGWYVVMSKFKLACMLEGVYVRQVENSTRETTTFLGEMVVRLIDDATEFIPKAADW